MLVAGLGAVFFAGLKESIISIAGGTLAMFIQRIFKDREDHYRALANRKHESLEYGNQWLLVIQSIDAISNTTKRQKRQSKLVSVLIEKMRGIRSEST